MKFKVGIAPLLSLLVAVIILCCGCSKSKAARSAATSGGKYFAVANATPFYFLGPQQPNGPDKTLPRDTLVTFIRSSFGYSKVRLATGEEGFVARNDIGPAPPALIAAVNTPPESSGAHVRPDPLDPRFLPPPESLPEFEPTPIPSPPDSHH